MVHQRARDRHALLLSAAQLARLVVQPFAESDARQRFRGQRPGVLPAAAAIVDQR
jgi:hypothetical protein